MNRKIHRFFWGLATAIATITTGLAEAKQDGVCGPIGSSRFLAAMPEPSNLFQPTGPTYPEGIAVLADRVITSGPANFGTANNNSPTQLTVFNRKTGALLQQVPVVGEDLSQEHALSELYAWKNYVYSPSTQLGVLRWKFEDNKAPVQEQVSTPFYLSSACSTPPLVPIPLPNGIVVDKQGDVYVADSLQGAIWHVPPAKGVPATPEVVFCSDDLRGTALGLLGPLGLFGANGIAIIGDYLYVSVTFGPSDPYGFPTSVIYRLPKKAPHNLETVYTYPPVLFVPPIADGLRVDPVSGHLFVVLGGQNQISELDVSGSSAIEVNRFSRTVPELTPPFANGPPFQNPSTIDILPNGTAYVSNHAIQCTLQPQADPGPCNGNATAYFGVVELCVR